MTRPGIVNLFKPEGISSNSAVNRVKRILGAKKCGHTGTLDPAADGVLLVLVDGATRFADLLSHSEKSYRAVIRLGHTTTTLDREGEDISVIPRDMVNISRETLELVLEGFRGEITQLPPMFSAVSKDGVRLYRLARMGIEIEREPRKALIHELRCLDYDEKQSHATLFVSCSKGTYIRSLADDIGRALGVGAMLYGLTRVSVGGFDEKSSVTLEELEKVKEGAVMPIDSVFSQLSSFAPPEFFATLMKNGQKIALDKLGIELETGSLVRLYDGDGVFFGLGRSVESDGEALLKLYKRI